MASEESAEGIPKSIVNGSEEQYNRVSGGRVVILK